MKGAGMPNIALKPFCSSNIGMKPILMVDLFPPCVHSAVRLHRELLGAPNSRPCTKWRVMADTEESATVTEIQDRSPSGKGFGSSSGRKGSSREKNKVPVVRRAPAEKPLRIPQGNAQSQQIETAFIISWAGLGILFLVEGIVLAASAMLLLACSCSCFSEGRRHEWTALLQDEGQEAENPYVFQEGSFVTTVRCQAGQIRALPNFRDRPELPRGVEDYRIVDTSLQPNSILLPHFVDAELILCVVRGRGRIAYVQEERLVERELEEGDVYAIPAASTHYLVNTDDSQPLRIYSLLRPESSAGSYATFYVVGGRDPQSVLSAFSGDVLQAAFKCPRDVLDRMLISGYKKGAIISASKEGIRRLISGRIKGLGGSEDPNPFNLLYRKPDFSNNNGHIYQALATDYRLLRGLNVGVQLTNLTAGSMTAPNYNTRAIRIAIVIKGQGRLEMAVPQTQGQAQTYQRVQASLNRGTVYVVPAGYPSTEIASLNGELQILSLEINSRGNRREFLAGRNNVLRYLRNEIKQLTLQYSTEEIEGVLKAQNDQLLLRGPERQGQADEQTSSSFWSF